MYFTQSAREISTNAISVHALSSHNALKVLGDKISGVAFILLNSIGILSTPHRMLYDLPVIADI